MWRFLFFYFFSISPLDTIAPFPADNRKIPLCPLYFCSLFPEKITSVAFHLPLPLGFCTKVSLRVEEGGDDISLCQKCLKTVLLTQKELWLKRF